MGGWEPYKRPNATNFVAVDLRSERPQGAPANGIFSHSFGLYNVPSLFEMTPNSRFRITASFLALDLSANGMNVAGGRSGDTFGVAIVFFNSGYDAEHMTPATLLGFNMQTTDVSPTERGVRIFRTPTNPGEPQPTDFLDPVVYNTLYTPLEPKPTLDLCAIVSTTPGVDSYAYIILNGDQRYESVRRFGIDPEFFTRPIMEVRALISTSNGPNLSIGAYLARLSIEELDAADPD